MQLLEQDGRLDAETIGNTAARLEGSFSLAILNQFNHLYLVKGNSPLCIYRFENGLICYASTADILKEALARCSFLPHNKEIVSLSEGDILCIIEAMKVMNEIHAPRAGVIKEIRAKDGDMVQFDEELMVIGD